jgi:hypothetical protein
MTHPVVHCNLPYYTLRSVQKENYSGPQLRVDGSINYSDKGPGSGSEKIISNVCWSNRFRERLYE